MALALPLSGADFVSDEALFGALAELIEPAVGVADSRSTADGWQAYLEAQLLAELEPARAQSASRLSGLAVTPLELTEQQIAKTGGRLELGLSAGAFGAAAGYTAQSALGVARPASSSSLQRTILSSSLTQPLPGDREFRVGAVLAFQRFASLDMGNALATGPTLLTNRAAESSHGTGVRLALNSPISEQLSWSVAYQSRIDMESFRSVQGLFSEPGKFDIPASGRIGLDYLLPGALSLGVAAQRIFYSDVAPFTSLALPDRFLALLGDGASPEFAWRDLTVYSATLSWAASSRDRVEFRYTTRQQPSPTSALLLDALRPEFTHRNFAAAWSRDLGRFGGLSVAASYAASEYFLGDLTMRSRKLAASDQVEVEAAWSLRF